MLIHNNEITITRGEAFSMINRLVNKDGSPYIVATGKDNPHWMVVVSASQYYQTNGYLMEVWAPVTTKRFNVTQAVDAADFGFTSWESFAVPDGYTGTNTQYAEVAIFKHYDELKDEWEYRYYDKIAKKWLEYDNIVSFQFTTDMTMQWSEQNYFYSITLVSGTKTLKALTDLALANGLSVSPIDTAKEIYDMLYELNPELVKYYDYEEPLVLPGAVQDVILPATKLSVVSNMKGAM